MTTAYLGNHVSPQGWGGEEGLQIQKDENSLVIFISAVCVCVWGGGGETEKCIKRKQSAGSKLSRSC